MNPKGNPQNLKPFKPGETGNPGGSAKGYRKTLQGDFLKQLAGDFRAHGREAIEQAREKDPLGYVRTVAQLLPKEVELVQPLEGLTDDELSAIAEQLRSALSAASIREGNSAPEEPSQVN